MSSATKSAQPQAGKAKQANKSSPEDTKHQVKTFGKSTRNVPHHSHKASRFYPAYDEPKPRKARKSMREWQPRKSLVPGTVLILLAGRFRGKRVVLLRCLSDGILLVTGPFKINGVPIRRVNSRYVIATSTKLDIKGLDEEKLNAMSDSKYFVGNKATTKTGEEAFFKQGEKQQGDKTKKKDIAENRKEDQKAIDKAIMASIKEVDYLASYLKSSWSLQKGDRPHEMVF